MHKQVSSKRPSLGQLPGRKKPPAGLTLIEILISTTLSLLLILAIAQSFATVSTTISLGRARLEMAERMRGTVLRLTTDLDSVSVPTLPWIDPATGAGYYEITEGAQRDYDVNINNVADWTEPDFDTSFGDCDDILAMTVVNNDTPFVGYVMGTLTQNPTTGRFTLSFSASSPKVRTKIISSTAEIIWWTTLKDVNNNGTRDPGEYYTLHRRVLLVRPDIDIDPVGGSLNAANWPYAFFFWGNDLSVVTNAAGNRFTNSLQDLSDRQRRTAHAGATVTFPLNRLLLMPQKNVWLPGPDGQWGVASVDDDGDGTADGADLDEAGAIESDDILVAENEGQDVILPHLLSFDVKVFDPLAPLKNSSNTIDLLAPGDPRYSTVTTAPSAAGEYVDLGYSLNPVNGSLAFAIPYATAFSGAPRVKTGQLAYASPTWDTFPTLYEMDGLDQDDTAPNILIDEGFDGLDNDGLNGVDDLDERETSPPYTSPLRGVKVTVRIIDSSSRQIRQEHVIVNFRPE